jgi:hypothetical protein
MPDNHRTEQLTTIEISGLPAVAGGTTYSAPRMPSHGGPDTHPYPPSHPAAPPSHPAAPPPQPCYGFSGFGLPGYAFPGYRFPNYGFSGYGFSGFRFPGYGFFR